MTVPSLRSICQLQLVENLVKVGHGCVAQENVCTYILDQLDQGAWGLESLAILDRAVKYYKGILTPRVILALLPRNTKCLTLKECPLLTEDCLNKVLERCIYLESLDLTENIGLNFSNVDLLMTVNFEKRKSLTAVILEDCPQVSDIHVQTLLLNVPNLQHLNIARCGITDNAFLLNEQKQLAREACFQLNGLSMDFDSKLHTVDVSRCQELSSTGVRYLCSLCGPYLQNIDLSWTKVDCTALLYLSGMGLPHAVQFFSLTSAVNTSLLESLVYTLHQFDATCDDILDKWTGEQMTEQTSKDSEERADNEAHADKETKSSKITDPSSSTVHLCDIQPELGASPGESIHALGHSVHENVCLSFLCDDTNPTSPDSEEKTDDFLTSDSKLECEPSHLFCDLSGIDISSGNQGAATVQSDGSSNDVHSNNVEFPQQRLSSNMQSPSVSLCASLNDQEKYPFCDIKREECDNFNIEHDDFVNAECDSVHYLNENTSSDIIGANSKVHAKDECDNRDIECNITVKDESDIVVVGCNVTKNDESDNIGIECNVIEKEESGNVNIECKVNEKDESEDIGIECKATKGDENDNVVMECNITEKVTETYENDIVIEKDECDSIIVECNMTDLHACGKEDENFARQDVTIKSVNHSGTRSVDNELGVTINQSTLDQEGSSAINSDTHCNQTNVSAEPSKKTTESTRVKNSASLLKMKMDFDPNINSLQMNGNIFRDENAGLLCLQTFLKANKNLHSLTLYGGMTGNFVTDMIVDLIGHYSHKLTYLSLEGCDQVTSIGASAIVQNCKQMATLDLTGVPFLSDAGIIPLLRSLPLTCLRLAETQISGHSLNAITKMSSVNELKELNLSWCEEIAGDSSLNELLHLCPSLKCLMLRETPLTANTLSLIADNCHNIIELSIASNMSNVLDESVTLLSENLPLLEIIDLSWNSHLTDKSIHSLLKNCRHLSKANLEGLKRITSSALVPILVVPEKLKDFFAKIKNSQTVTQTSDEPDIRIETLPCLPHRSTTYCTELCYMNLKYSDFVEDTRLQELVTVTQGGIKIIDYYGEKVEQSRTALENLLKRHFDSTEARIPGS